MPILTNEGRVVIAESIALRSVHLAWGAGDGSWIVPPSEDAHAEALIDEIGRRTASEVSYVEPSPAGSITLPSGTYAVSATPTNHLYIVGNFDFSDAQSAVIREMAVFVGSAMVGGLPAGQKYFTPDQVITPGRMLHLEHFAPIFRSPSIRENFQVVITF